MSYAEGILAAKESALALGIGVSIVGFFGDSGDEDDEDGDGGPDTVTPQPPTKVHSRK